MEHAALQTKEMSSSVFFRFKSQREPSRITFDGTGISVFELKRDIIAQNKLGDGTDFELIISSEDADEGIVCLSNKVGFEADFAQNTTMTR